MTQKKKAVPSKMLNPKLFPSGIRKKEAVSKV
jgi:hypothetical protein